MGGENIDICKCETAPRVESHLLRLLQLFCSEFADSTNILSTAGFPG